MSRFYRQIARLGLGFVAAATVAAEIDSAKSLAQRPTSAHDLFFSTVRRMATWWDASRQDAPVVQADLEIIATEGFPAGLVGQRVRYIWQCADRAQLIGKIGSEAFTLGRVGTEVWLHRPQKSQIWRAPASPSDPVGPLTLPMMDVWLPQLSSLFTVRRDHAAEVSGTRCEVLVGTSSSAARKLLHAPVTHVTLWLGEVDRRLHQVRVAVPEKRWSMTVGIKSLYERASGDAPVWTSPTTPGNRVEKVSLARIRGSFPDAMHELGVVSMVAP